MTRMAWRRQGSTKCRLGVGAWRTANGGDTPSGCKEEGSDGLGHFGIASWHAWVLSLRISRLTLRMLLGDTLLDAVGDCTLLCMDIGLRRRAFLATQPMM